MPDPSEAIPPGEPYDTRQLANVAAAVRAQEHPSQIGPYKIEGVLGEGGMGTVYRASQTDPISRVVAIKVIKIGLDTKEVIRRFDTERQTLAMMEHPNIARVLDAGISDIGRPYFVMEYVAGPSLTTYADSNQLTVRDRLELFLQACAAVQHAHQKAIIHRDIKPSNILVTERDGKPTVRVIDFGVATAMRKEIADKTTFIETGQLMGTPEYMAPEQTNTPVVDVDTRTDVYSLGVVLYELLSGALPFDAKTLRSAGYAEIQRIIREVDPPTPSTRLSSLLGDDAKEIARRRQTPLQLLEKQLKSELEWIPLKAMHKERAERYASATELADDIQNYLASRPLRAGPLSRGYRVRKFLKRHRASVAAVTVMLALLLGGIAATTWQAVRATRAEAKSRDEAIRATHAETVSRTEAERATAAEAQSRAEQEATGKVNDFLIEMFQSVDPSVSKGKPVMVADVLDKASENLGEKFKEQPQTEAAIRAALGAAYTGISQFEKAEPHIERALQLYETLLGEDDAKTINMLEFKGILRNRQGKWAEAISIAETAYDRNVRLHGADSFAALNSLNNKAVVQQLTGEWKEAEAAFRRILARYIVLFGADSSKTLDAERKIAKILVARARYEEAEPIMRRLLENLRRVNGESDRHTLSQMVDLAFVLKNLSKAAEARDMAQVAFDRSLVANGELHIQTVSAEYMLAMCTADTGDRDRAFELFFSAIERSKKVYGPDVPATLSIMNGTSTELARVGRLEEAAALQRTALDGLTRSTGPDAPQRLTALFNLCRTLLRQGYYDTALPLAQELEQRLAPGTKVQFDAKRAWRFRSLYGVTLSKLSRPEEAFPRLTEAYEALTAAGGNEDVIAEVLDALVQSATALNRPADTEIWTSRRAKWQASTQPATRPTAPVNAP